MKVIVTAGPSYEPIDEVRRLTNFSTGELGVMLSNQLGAAGFEVFCLRGTSSTYPGSLTAAHHLPFSTNDDLFQHLVRLGREHEIGAVFHTAALCDFKVRRVENSEGAELSVAKLDSRGDSLTLILEPAPKLIARLRGLFPKATLVGWKYELAGTGAQAMERAWEQIRDNQTDACVLNGRAYGTGFALCTPPSLVQEAKDKSELTQLMSNWLVGRHC